LVEAADLQDSYTGSASIHQSQFFARTYRYKATLVRFEIHVNSAAKVFALEGRVSSIRNRQVLKVTRDIRPAVIYVRPIVYRITCSTRPASWPWIIVIAIRSVQCTSSRADLLRSHLQARSASRENQRSKK
jgi:hypothetical protein